VQAGGHVEGEEREARAGDREPRPPRTAAHRRDGQRDRRDRHGRERDRRVEAGVDETSRSR
jgi:hypothetical protein